MENRAFSAWVLFAKSHLVVQENLVWLQGRRAKQQVYLGLEFNSLLTLLAFFGIFSCDEGDFLVYKIINDSNYYYYYCWKNPLSLVNKDSWAFGF